MQPKNFRPIRLREEQLRNMGRIMENYANENIPELQGLRVRIDAQNQGVETVYTFLGELEGKIYKQYFTESLLHEINGREEAFRYLAEQFYAHIRHEKGLLPDEHLINLLQSLL